MRTLTLVLTALLLATAPSLGRAEEAKLVILHTSDLHGSLYPYDDLAQRPVARGLVKVASLVDSVRATGLPVLLLDAGDTVEGPGMEAVHQLADSTSPDPMIAAMNQMGYDAMCVGNHEFDFGRRAWERARREAKFPWLAANIETEPPAPPGSHSPSAFDTSLIKLVGGIRVGVVGITTPATPAFVDADRVAGLRFVSPLDAARREVKRLREVQHCDLIVLLAHTGLERDSAAVFAAQHSGAPYTPPPPDENWGYRLATEVPGVNVVVLGHTHVVVSRDVGGVTVAQAGKFGEGLGRIDIALARGSDHDPWKITRSTATFVPVRTETPDQAAIAAIAAPYRDSTKRALDRVVGRCTSPVTAPGGRLADGSLWEVIHRVQLQASGADVSLAALLDPDAAIPAGPVTVRQLMRAYPYQNTLGSVRLTGAQLRAVLEHAASLLAAYDFQPGASLWAPGASPQNFDAAKGVTYEIDLAKPDGQRVMNLKRRGKPVADGDSLTVVANSYRLGGGGGYPWLANAPRVWRTDRRVQELMLDYAQKRAVSGAEFTRGWRVLPEFLGTPERPLIERLVTRGVVPKAVAHDLNASGRARRGDIAYWIARSFEWRERPENAYVDVPDSLAPWIEGLVEHKVVSDQVTTEGFRPFEALTMNEALDWCERTARRAGYNIAPAPDNGFRHALAHRMSDLPLGSPRDSLTNAQVLGLVANLRYPEIRILETTDFHGAILGGSRDRRSGRQLGGSATLAAWVNKLRAENPDGTVLIDGGDCFQGTMISNLQFGRPVVEQMNAMRYSAMAVGNHEFDWSADTLEHRVRAMNFAALGANMIELKTKHRPRWARADTVVTRKGVRLGVLGMCYRFTPTVTLAKNVAHLRFDDDSATAVRLVPELAKRSDIVIGVGHIPAESDSAYGARSGDLPRLARGVPGVTAWFGGHSHNLVSDRVNGVPVMIAGSHGEAVAVCDLVIDPVAHKAVDSRIALVRTWADEVTPDSLMQLRVQAWNALVAPIAAVRVGTNAHTLMRNRGGESTVGNLVADAIRAAAGTDIAMQNSGGLRADLQEGEITRGSIYEVMPFDNQVFTLGLTGREVRLALEEALKSGRATQVSGIRYSFDPDRAAMDRVVSLTDVNGAALDTAKVYRVAVNDFMATGGDNYDVLAGGLDRTNTQILVRDALEKFIAERSANGPLEYSGDGRVQRVDGKPAPPNNPNAGAPANAAPTTPSPTPPK